MNLLRLPPTHFYALSAAIWLLPGAVLLPSLLRWAGLVVFVAGVGLLLWASQRYRVHDAEINTYGTPRNLVVDGPFAWSRNPMYLGFAVALVGQALGRGTAVAWGAPVVFFALASRWYIPFEERAAEEVFGEAYRAYAARTRRWLGTIKPPGRARPTA